MIKIYHKRKQNIKKTIDWMETHGLPYELVTPQSLTYDDLKHILSLTDGGFSSIMTSNHVGRYSEKVNAEELSTEECVAFLLKFSQYFLKAPIIFDQSSLCLGYDAERLRTFIPSSRNTVALRKRWGLRKE